MTSVNVLPQLAPTNGTDDALCDAELDLQFAQFGSLRTAVTHPNDLIGGQFGVGDGFSVQAALPSLAIPIPHIVGLRPEEEMVGPRAGRVVAVVKNIQAVRNGTDVDLPRDSMRGLAARCSPRSGEQKSITKVRPGTSPIPTSLVVDNDLSSITFLPSRHPLHGAPASDGAEPTSTLVSLRSVDGRSAVFAGVVNAAHVAIIGHP